MFRGFLCVLVRIPSHSIVCWLIRVTEHPVSSSAFTGCWLPFQWSIMKIIGRSFFFLFFPGAESSGPGSFLFLFEVPHTRCFTLTRGRAEFLKNLSLPSLPKAVDPWPFPRPLPPSAVLPLGVPQAHLLFSVSSFLQPRPSMVPVARLFPVPSGRRSSRRFCGLVCHIASSLSGFSGIPLPPCLVLH